MSKKDRLILEEIVDYVCEYEGIEKANTAYAKYDQGILGFLRACYSAKTKTLIFNSDYFVYTSIDDILHEIGHHISNVKNPDYLEWDKPKREVYADPYMKKLYTKYKNQISETIKQVKPRHHYLKSRLSLGLHFWTPNSEDLPIDHYLSEEESP